MRLSRDVLSLLKRDGNPSGIRANLLNIHIFGSVEQDFKFLCGIVR